MSGYLTNTGNGSARSAMLFLYLGIMLLLGPRGMARFYGYVGNVVMSGDLDMLRKRARELEPKVRIGKKGLTEGVVLEVKRHLDKERIVKVKVLRNKKEDFQKILESLLKETGAKLINSIGYTFVLYKPNKR